jgi:hypothetical protein
MRDAKTLEMLDLQITQKSAALESTVSELLKAVASANLPKTTPPPSYADLISSKAEALTSLVREIPSPLSSASALNVLDASGLREWSRWYNAVVQKLLAVLQTDLPSLATFTVPTLLNPAYIDNPPSPRSAPTPHPLTFYLADSYLKVLAGVTKSACENLLSLNASNMTNQQSQFGMPKYEKARWDVVSKRAASAKGAREKEVAVARASAREGDCCCASERESRRLLARERAREKEVVGARASAREGGCWRASERERRRLLAPPAR